MNSSSTTISRPDETITGRKHFLRDVIHGLRRPQKEVPCKYFYDERGSALFDEICELDEYYLTRSELAILDGARTRDGRGHRHGLRADRVRQRQRTQDATAPRATSRAESLFADRHRG